MSSPEIPLPPSIALAFLLSSILSVFERLLKIALMLGALHWLLNH